MNATSYFSHLAELQAFDADRSDLEAAENHHAGLVASRDRAKQRQLEHQSLYSDLSGTQQQADATLQRGSEFVDPLKTPAMEVLEGSQCDAFRGLVDGTDTDGQALRSLSTIQRPQHVKILANLAGLEQGRAAYAVATHQTSRKAVALALRAKVPLVVAATAVVVFCVAAGIDSNGWPMDLDNTRWAYITDGRGSAVRPLLALLGLAAAAMLIHKACQLIAAWWTAEPWIRALDIIGWPVRAGMFVGATAGWLMQWTYVEAASFTYAIATPFSAFFSVGILPSMLFAMTGLILAAFSGKPIKFDDARDQLTEDLYGAKIPALMKPLITT